MSMCQCSWCGTRIPVKGRCQCRDPFLLICEAAGLEKPVPEYQFDQGRKWRFDWAWIGQKVALEVQGGLFSGGRHVRGAALLKEHEKLNAAAIAGWAVLFTTPDQLLSHGVDLVKQAIDSEQQGGERCQSGMAPTRRAAQGQRGA